MDSISVKMQTATKLRGTLLVDTIPGVRLQLVESSKTRGKLVVRGVFAHIGRPTANGRVYPLKIFERQIARLKEAMVEGGLFGHLDHPPDGTTLLKDASHLVTKLEIEGDRVYGEARIMDTPEGLKLRAIYAAGARVGVSSRGFGSTRKDNQGNDVVQDDFELLTFDFVAEPAAATYPEAFTEKKETGMDQKQLKAKELREENIKLYQHLLRRCERLMESALRREEARARRTDEARTHERQRSRLREATRRTNERLEEVELPYPYGGSAVIESRLPMDAGDFALLSGLDGLTRSPDKFTR
jgi:hypothetical protein